MTRRLRLLGKWLAAVLIVAVVITAGAVGLWRLTWMAPSWWAPLDPQDQQTARLAERVEYRLAEEAHKVRADPKPWWLEIKQEQINAWLAARLPEWVAHAHGIQWPAEVGLPQVDVGQDTVRLGLDIETDVGTRYVVAHLRPSIADGELSLALNGISFGRLWIPGSSVATAMERLADTEAGRFLDDPGVKALIGLLEGDQRLDPTLTLSDGRRVQVLDLRCNRGALLLKAETVAQK
ncbi:MAG: hypothetical protein ACYTGC_05630 [Planctomycetota bacterium]|jgi:hypothetical protein